MKTQYKLTNETELNTFVPVEGTWDLLAGAGEDHDQFAAEQEIAADIESKHGFAVKVELFREDGRAIGDNFPWNGQLLVTRK